MTACTAGVGVEFRPTVYLRAVTPALFASNSAPSRPASAYLSPDPPQTTRSLPFFGRQRIRPSEFLIPCKQTEGRCAHRQLEGRESGDRRVPLRLGSVKSASALLPDSTFLVWLCCCAPYWAQVGRMNTNEKRDAANRRIIGRILLCLAGGAITPRKNSRHGPSIRFAARPGAVAS